MWFLLNFPLTYVIKIITFLFVILYFWTEVSYQNSVVGFNVLVDMKYTWKVDLKCYFEKISTKK